jgi:hypothetical protein
MQESAYLVRHFPSFVWMEGDALCYNPRKLDREMRKRQKVSFSLSCFERALLRADFQSSHRGGVKRWNKRVAASATAVQKRPRDLDDDDDEGTAEKGVVAPPLEVPPPLPMPLPLVTRERLFCHETLSELETDDSEHFDLKMAAAVSAPSVPRAWWDGVVCVDEDAHAQFWGEWEEHCSNHRHGDESFIFDPGDFVME